ncbi:MAG: transposase [Sphaerochaeta sp.]|nr:transposase [Sphaerochaeta sp.]
MMETEDDKQERIDKLEAQVAALTLSVKAANKRYEGSVLKYDALDATHSKTLEDHSKTLEDYNRLLVFVDSLQENISIDKCMLWAAKTEKQSSKELKQLRKDLADHTITNQERTRDLDIAEADAPPQSSNDAVIAGILGDRPEKPESGKKRWGRQPGVQTCGRKMSSFDALPRHEVNNDLREVSDAEYAATLTFIKTVTHQQFDYVKGYYRNRVTITHLYSDKDGKVVSLCNKLAPDFVKGGKLTNGAAAAIVADKVLWGLPIYRQAKRINMINSSNIVDAQILNSYFLAAGDLVTPVWEDLLSYIKGQKAIHGDETTLLCIHNTEKEKSALGYVWALSYQGNDHPASYFHFYNTRGYDCARALFGDCRGIALQSDAYGAYSSTVGEINKSLAETVGQEEGEEAARQFLQDTEALLEKGIVLAGCLAHYLRSILTREDSRKAS